MRYSNQVSVSKGYIKKVDNFQEHVIKGCVKGLIDNMHIEDLKVLFSVEVIDYQDLDTINKAKEQYWNGDEYLINKLSELEQQRIVEIKCSIEIDSNC